MPDPALRSPYEQGILPAAPPLQEDEVRSEIQADVPVCLVLSVTSKTVDYQLVLCIQYTFVHGFLYTVSDIFIYSF